ncbi:hypothetical protein U9I18_000111 [Bacillus phage KKP_4048]
MSSEEVVIVDTEVFMDSGPTDNQVWVKILRPFGYWVEEHKVGEIFRVSEQSVSYLVDNSLVKIIEGE